MEMKQRADDIPESSATSAARHSNVSVLAVGAPEEWTRNGNALPVNGTLAFVSFSEVTDSLLQQLSPVAVVSPVLAKGFDCIDLALLLHSLNYQGSYRAAAPDLPKPKLIEAEIAQICPRLDFGIVMTP